MDTPNAHPMANVFHSQRLFYRALEDNPEDEDFLFKVSSNPASLSNSNFSLVKPYTRKEAKGYLTTLTKDDILISVVICLSPSSQEGKPEESKSINDPKQPTDKEENEPKPTQIGLITLWPLYNRNTSHNPHRNGSISINILPQYQSKGYGTEAINWILDWSFRVAGLHRISIECFGWNEGAKKLYARIGFTLEGTFKEVFWFNGGWGDLCSFGMLERDWEERSRGEGKGNDSTVSAGR